MASQISKEKAFDSFPVKKDKEVFSKIIDKTVDLTAGVVKIAASNVINTGISAAPKKIPELVGVKLAVNSMINLKAGIGKKIINQNYQKN